MWDDDRALRAEVLAELDTAPPPVGGGLAEVVRRGRWRRRGRYASAAAGVAALLTVTGVVATALAGEPLPAAQPPAATDVDWPRAGLPAQVPYDVWAFSAPRRVYQLCSIPETATDRLDVHRATDDERNGLQAALHAVAPPPGATIPALVEQHLVPDRPEKREGWVYEVDVDDAEGTGSLRFGIGDYTGTPLAAADAQAFDVGNCAPPKRHVLADGTVLQLYEPRPSEPFQSLTQTLRIFLPNGRLYQVVAQNWGSPDLETNRAQPGNPTRVGTGRSTLPLTEKQLTGIGLDLTR